jgi:hypothetical protein
MEKKVYCIVLNWNGKRYLKNCLDAVIASSYKNLKIIVVDNGSTDGSGEFVKANYKQITLIKNRSNMGWTGGNNKGIKYALKNGADVIFILNNDTEIEKRCIEELLAVLESREDIGVVGPKIYLSVNGKKTKRISFVGGKFTPNRYFGIHKHNNKIDTGKYNKVKETDFITGAAIMVKSNVFKKVGLFDDKYFIYYDEADFCVRTRENGYKIFIVPKGIVYHEFSGTVELNSPFQNYYTTRNHYLFVEKNAPWNVKIREFLRTPKTAYEFYKSADKNRRKYSLLGIRDYYLRRFGKRTYW